MRMARHSPAIDPNVDLSEAADPHVPDVVVGWVQAGPLDEMQAEAFEAARGLVAEP